jgi:hypothetical protein
LQRGLSLALPAIGTPRHLRPWVRECPLHQMPICVSVYTHPAMHDRPAVRATEGAGGGFRRARELLPRRLVPRAALLALEPFGDHHQSKNSLATRSPLR